MHIHILGICGTFMAGIASIAKQAGHKVTGADQNVYPPMSDFLDDLGIAIHQGYDAEQLDIFQADIYIVGNVMTRGHAVIEAILNKNLAYSSGPEWLYQNVLKQQKVIAVAGTHGKTTTSSMLTWLLEAHGLEPGFLIGGMPGNFNVSARLGAGKVFVIEADEYDTAFFDKRSKFIHYRPDIALLNNIEFDHADIFDSIDDIKRQFHHMVRCIPSQGNIIFNADDNNVIDVLNKGLWTGLTGFSRNNTAFHQGSASPIFKKELLEDVYVLENSDNSVNPSITNKNSDISTNNHLPIGEHNQLNALGAMLCAMKLGISLEQSIAYFEHFIMPKRRLEVLLNANASPSKATVYRDFAHHPTAIKHTLNTLKLHHQENTLIAVIEMRSNSMKQGVHDDLMQAAISDSDLCFILAASDAQQLRLEEKLATTKHSHIQVFSQSEALLSCLVTECISNRQENPICVAFLTNSNFDGISEIFTEQLSKKH